MTDSVLRRKVLIGIGDALRFNILETLVKHSQSGLRLSPPDIRSITVPHWLYSALQQVEGRTVPRLLGAPVLSANDWLASDEVVLDLVNLGRTVVELTTIPAPPELKEPGEMI